MANEISNWYPSPCLPSSKCARRHFGCKSDEIDIHSIHRDTTYLRIKEITDVSLSMHLVHVMKKKYVFRDLSKPEGSGDEIREKMCVVAIELIYNDKKLVQQLPGTDLCAFAPEVRQLVFNTVHSFVEEWRHKSVPMQTWNSPDLMKDHCRSNVEN